MTRNPLIDGRRADSARRRQRVISAIHAARAAHTEVSVAAIARAAGVDRTFLYRHRDLLEQLQTAQSSPAAELGTASVSRASLQADLANAHGQLTRQATHIRHLEHRLSQLLGDQAWREAGIGAPTDIDFLQRRIAHLEQQIVDLHDTIAQRDEELDAARGANRELIANLNRRTSLKVP
jgi:chromosome segregation ATPase